MKFALVFFVLSFVVCSLVAPPASAAEPAVIRKVLWQLYQQTGGSLWVRQTNWGTENYCTWENIKCFSDGTFTLDLSANGLEGTIPQSLGELGTSVTSLVLHRNRLYGTLPASLGDLTALVAFDISQNSFIGTIPASLGNLVNAKLFSIYDNTFSGEISSNLQGLLQNVKQGCRLARNFFNCPIPSWVPSECSAGCYSWPASGPTVMTNVYEQPALYRIQEILTEFYYATGGPSWVLQNLWASDVAFCFWEGIVCQLAEETFTLDLNANGLIGTIPESFGELGSSITSLLLDRNTLVGTIPESLGELSSLVQFDISQNILTGPIPLSLGNLTKTQLFWISDNLLTGDINFNLLPILQNVVQYQATQGCRLAGNYFNCPVPSWVPPQCGAGCHVYPTPTPPPPPPPAPRIEDLLTEFFYATGGPQWVRKNLWASEESHCLWENIECDQSSGTFTLDVSANGLIGSIPNSFGQLSTSITSLLTNRNTLVGTIPESLGNLTALVQFDVSQNILTGDIPLSLGQLVNTQLFWISDNLLTGAINDNLQPILENVVKYQATQGCRLAGNYFNCPVPVWVPPVCGAGCHVNV